MKQKITAGTVKGLYQDMVTLLSKTGQECVTVASNKEDQTFTFFKPRYFVASVSGKWTADKVAYPQVGPTGHPSSTSGHERIDKKYALGQLLISSKDNKGAWLPWVGWNGALSYDHYLNEVKMVMNDYRTSFGDNSGSIKVCFE
ncbi:MAG TPA: hypothetical protein VE954_40015 [Oligoflexus sp.]|uniref:hypothetical protein n=1 Tax=Oligoflexus sp. TaxID=1971216 RepID=UPI002D4D2E7C|nr:hypothetical protein [Oligoflexus sp.]HYX39329.1 hypothetical protein [Oligoflexus sp.]